MDVLLNFLHSIRPLSPELREALTGMLKSEKIAQGEFTLREGNVCTKICFIEKGLFGCFYQAEEKEVASWFMKQGDIFSSIRSWFDQVPSRESIMALEDSVVWGITHKQYTFLKKNFPEFEAIVGELLEYYYKELDDRLYVTINRSAKKRCEYFFTIFPELAQIVPDKYVASYLGMNASTFSRAKKRFFRERTKLVG